MANFDFLYPTLIMAVDLSSVHAGIMGFIGSLLLPIFILAALAGAMGVGGSASLGEAIADSLGTFLVIVLEILLRTGSTICVALVAILSALVRFIVLYLSRNKIKLKVGEDEEKGQSPPRD